MASGAPPSTAIPAPVAASGDSKDSKWFMTLEQVQNSPSRRDGIPPDQELNLRQKAAYLIQEMGQKLRVSQLCINTAIVYMHRFYMYHSFTHFHRNGIAAAGLFLAAKVEEQPRKLESVIQVLHACLNFKIPEPQSAAYQEQAQDLVFNENVLLQTLGFDVAVDHPHTHVVKTCHLVKACKDLAQTSYFLASNSLHLTTMCLQYRPTVVACFCIYLACKWSRWEIPQSTEGKFWFHYVDRTVTLEILEQLTNEFLVIYENSPSRLKKQLSTYKGLGLNAKSPCAPGARSSSQHHPGAEHSRSQGSSSQRSTVHHHASKMQAHGMGGDHSTSKTIPNQTLPLPKSSLSGMSSSSGRQPSRPERGDHRNNNSEPHFSAPHRTGGSSSSSAHNSLPPLTRGTINDQSMSLPPMQQTAPHPSQTQRPDPSAFPGSNPHSSSASNSNKSRHHQQQPPYQQMQLTSGHMVAPDSRPHKQPMDLIHQKQRTSSSSKDPPPKYMDPKMGATKKIPTQHIGGTTNKYPDQTKPSALPHPQHSNQSHLASKSSNYPLQPQQQPPNYNQSMSNRNAQPQTGDIHNLSVHHHQHQSTQNNLYNLSSESSYNSRQKAPSDDLLHNNTLLDSVDSKTGFNQLSTGKVPSIFSPDWSEKSIKSEYKSASQPLDSPKMQRATETTPKKEKKRESPMNSGTSQKFPSSMYPVADIKRSNSNSSSSSATTVTASKRNHDFSASTMPVVSVQNSQYDKATTYKSRQSAIKMEDGDEESKSMLNVKRSHSDASMFSGNLFEETMADFHRDIKFRKVDLEAPQQQHQFGGSYSQSGSLIKPNTFNGIETNPDLVSSLLKESLGEAKYSTIQMEPMPPHHILQQSASLIQPISDGINDSFKTTNLVDTKPQIQAPPPPYQNHQPLQEQPPHQQHSNFEAKSISMPPPPTDMATASSEYDGDLKTKSEKKKKKDKNKHKEKDKSKDREERKKHKKDKDRSRDKEHRDDGIQNPIKIKIPKEKLNLSSGADGGVHPPPTSGFKITIPKDRLTTSVMDTSAPPSGASLKIKISKDVIESYSSSTQSYGGVGGAAGGYDASGGLVATHTNHHHHSKKRDRDRGDRGEGKGQHDAAATMHRSGAPGAANSSNPTKDVWVNQ